MIFGQAFKRAAPYGHRRQFRVVGAGIYLFVDGRKYIPGVNVKTEKGMIPKQNQSQVQVQPLTHQVRIHPLDRQVELTELMIILCDMTKEL